MAIAAVVVLSLSRCANTRQGPTGGPKDTIPPVLLHTAPMANTINFKGDKITLTFNENMQVKDASKNVVLSPPALLRPVVRRSGHSINVILQDTLQRDRTYTIDFGSSLVDNNESNPYPPYKFTFSTGPVIDSMVFTGVVRDAFTQEPLAGMTVMLYENLSDTAIYKTMPVAIARTDAWGYFAVQNIAPRTYRMIAIEDKNSNYRYDAGSEKIAFLDSTVVPEETVSELPPLIDIKDTVALEARPFERFLFASKENAGKQYLVEYPQLGKRQFKLVFNQRNPEIHSFVINDIDSTGYVVESSRFGDTLTYWLTAPTLPDTLRATINYLKTDSLEQLSLTETLLKFSMKKDDKKKEEKKKEGEEEKPKLQPKIDFNLQNGMHRGITITFDALPVKIDTSKLALFKINTEKKTRTAEPFRWVRDTTSLLRFYVQAKWTTVTDYEFVADSAAFINLYGLVNDSTGRKITTPNPEKFCMITLNLSNASSQYIVQLLDKKKEKVQRESIVSGGKVVFDYLQAGDYCIRFIDDENRNGVWDPASVKENKQSEKVAFVRFTNSDVLTLKENFEVDHAVDVAKLFEPPQPHVHSHRLEQKHGENGEHHEETPAQEQNEN